MIFVVLFANLNFICIKLSIIRLSITYDFWQDVIPHMANEYGFEYELITYKWPTWLHKQKEKQRIIWAYKILFLDVIFPLALEKVYYGCFNDGSFRSTATIYVNVVSQTAGYIC